jgi:spore germination cell wall hydrolase CwlJ-like protein
MMFVSKSKSILCGIICTLMLSSFPTLSQEITDAVLKQEVNEDFNKQLACLTKNVYYEAASESYEGKLAVAQVTINRANDPKFPSTICGVVYQRTLGTCQFSWTCLKNLAVQNKYAWEESEMVARKALTEPNVHDTIARTNALYYHAVYVNPGWRGRVITKIGNHVFYATN